MFKPSRSRTGRYKIVKVDIERPLPEVVLQPEEGGLAIEVFKGDRPIGFVMSCKGQEHIALEEMCAQFLPSGEAVRAPAAPAASALQKGEALPSVTVAVCTKDHPELLARCLRSIEVLVADPPAARPEVLVVDNASSTAETRKVCATFAHVRCVREELPGLNFARNRALAETDTELLAFIDDDAVADPQWLSGLLAAWQASPHAGAFTGQTLPLELETEAQTTVEMMGGFRKGFEPVEYGPTGLLDPLYPCTTVFGNGCNMAFRVEVLRSLGGFDEALDVGTYLPGGGDLDALYRVVRSGRPLVYEPRMLLRHQHRRDMRDLRRQVRRSWGTACMAFLIKVRDHDQEMSDKARRFIRWWIKDLVWRIATLRDTPEQPWRIAVHELLGAIDGLTGAYARSARRSARLRRAYDAG